MTPSLSRSRVDHRVKQLTDVLTRELQGSPEKSLRGGPQVTRRAVTQLIRLGRSTLVSKVNFSRTPGIDVTLHQTQAISLRHTNKQHILLC